MKAVRLLPLLAAVAFGMFVAASPAARAEAAPHALRLLTYNLNYGNPDVDATLAAIERADADIVLLQEVTAEWKHALLDRLAARYPHRAFRIHPTRAAGGLAVLSRLPIEAEELLPCPERGWFPAERIILRTTFGPLQILNVHLRPAIDRGSWIRGYLTTPPLRRREIETYWRKMKYDLPTIVAGDFNEEPSGSAVTYLKRHGMSRVATTGPTTWHYTTRMRGHAADVLRLDIDHVMIDGNLAARDARVLDAGTSDHRPVVVTIAPARGRS